MKFQKVIEKRRSIRKFLDKDVDKKYIDLIIKNGILAPSSKNKQPWNFVVVKGLTKTRIGDRMLVKGLDGSKKLKDIFIDKKISLNKRDSWPVVVDSEGKIVWIPGIKKSVFDKKKIETSPIIKHIMEKCTIQDVRLYEPDLEGTIRKIYERKG